MIIGKRNYVRRTKENGRIRGNGVLEYRKAE